MSDLYNIKRKNMLLLYHEKDLFIGVGAIGKEVIVPFFLKHGMYVTFADRMVENILYKKTIQRNGLHECIKQCGCDYDSTT